MPELKTLTKKNHSSYRYFFFYLYRIKILYVLCLLLVPITILIVCENWKPLNRQNSFLYQIAYQIEYSKINANSNKLRLTIRVVGNSDVGTLYDLLVYFRICIKLFQQIVAHLRRKTNYCILELRHFVIFVEKTQYKINSTIMTYTIYFLFFKRYLIRRHVCSSKMYEQWPTCYERFILLIVLMSAELQHRVLTKRFTNSSSAEWFLKIVINSYNICVRWQKLFYHMYELKIHEVVLKPN